MVDPLVGKTLDDDVGVAGSSYQNWDGNDSFLMGRTYDSDDIALTGWMY